MGRCPKVVLNHQSRAPHLRFQTCDTAQNNHSAPKNMNRRAIDSYYFTIFVNKMLLLLERGEPLTMHLSLRSVSLKPARDLPFPAKGTFQHTGHKKRLAFASLFRPKASDYLEYSSTMLVSLTSSLYGSSSLCGKRTRVAVQLSKDFSMYGRSKVLASWKDCLNISLDL